MASKVYEIVTEKIITQIEEAIKNGGCAPWRRPWNVANAPMNYVTQRYYRGVNLMLLDGGTEFITWNQICDLQKSQPDIKLRKGSKGSMVVYFAFQDKLKEVVNPTSGQLEQKTVKVPFLRYYNVFNIKDVDGLEPHERETFQHTPILEAEKIVHDYFDRESGLSLRKNEGQKACYNSLFDCVSVPSMELFPCVEEYYSTVFHEMTHSTGHPKRLNRLKNAMFADEEYSKEELTAEIGSSLLCASAGIDTSKTESNSISYLYSWLQALRNDATLIVSASAKAQRAADYIRGIDNP